MSCPTIASSSRPHQLVTDEEAQLEPVRCASRPRRRHVTAFDDTPERHSGSVGRRFTGLTIGHRLELRPSWASRSTHRSVPSGGKPTRSGPADDSMRPAVRPITRNTRRGYSAGCDPPIIERNSLNSDTLRAVINRRDFLGGAVWGSAAGAAAAVLTEAGGDHPEPPVPASPPPPPTLPEHARLSFSQQGEDIVLFHVLRELMKIAAPKYMDVGAAYPVRGNNTYLLYTTGARGVLVEPNPALAAQLRSKRPGDTVVEAGIGVEEAAQADYYEIKGNAMLNTFSLEQVAHLQRGKTESVVERVVKIPLLNINSVIQEHLRRAPDLLSTDVEGLDDAIIRTLDLRRFRPAVICAEAIPTIKSGTPSRTTWYLASQGYIPRGGSVYNTIYVDARRI